MFTFRQKIFISYVIAFLVFLGLMFPFASRTVNKIVTKAMIDRADELILRIQSAPNDDALIRRLKDQKHMIFFRVSIINDERKLLYDSHIKRLLGPKFSQEKVIDHPEVVEAFLHGYGYNEDYSDLLGQKFAYMGRSFNFHGKTYVMRTAFPYKYVIEMTRDFEIGFLGLATGVLLLFSVMTWLITSRLTKPIHQIIQAVKPYQEGLLPTIPEIKVGTSNPNDEMGKLASTLNDLSAIVQHQIDTLTAERNEKEALLESLSEGVIALDGNMTVIYANQTALRFLGLQHEDLVGHSFKECQQQKCYDLAILCHKEHKTMSDTMQSKFNNQKLYIDLVASPIRNRGGVILVLQDKTAHYKILEMRKDFIANASHELKTPVTVIQGFAETLQDAPDLPVETRLEITGKIVRSCLRMTKLIKDLLTLADIENLPTSRLSECDLKDLVESCRELVLDAFPDATIDIKADSAEEYTMIADNYLMEMALMNLMENAAKYSKGPAHITVSFEKLPEDWMRIKIADRGIGIPPADLEHIFQRFYTVDKAHSRKMGGSGLGLSLVETTIEKHFGKISVESEVGKGTTFTIILPTSRELIENGHRI